MVLSHFKSSSMKIFFSFSILIFLILLIISIAIYKGYESQVLEEQNRISLQMLSQTEYFISFINDQLIREAIELHNDGIIYHALLKGIIQNPGNI